MNPIAFKSKADTWILLAVYSAPMAGLVVLVAGLATGESAGIWTGVATALFGAVFVRALVLPMRYMVLKDRVRIHSGWIKLEVLYDELAKAEPSRDLISSPALSLDRLKLTRTSGTSVCISVDDKAEFLRAIASQDGRFVVQAESLHRRDDESLSGGER